MKFVKDAPKKHGILIKKYSQNHGVEDNLEKWSLTKENPRNMEFDKRNP